VRNVFIPQNVGSRPSDLSTAAMKIAIRDTSVEKPPEPEAAIDPTQYGPQKVNPDEIETRNVSVNLAEMMKRKTIEDLLELEWLSVQR
jgi:hypothetical protein